MSKKVLVLSASPKRGGNSELLCDQFVKGALEAREQAEKIFLAAKKIQYCTGCGVCINRKGGDEQCQAPPWSKAVPTFNS